MPCTVTTSVNAIESGAIAEIVFWVEPNGLTARW